ncbi:MAG: proline racemase family protein [Thermomicrobiales bacterium]
MAVMHAKGQLSLDQDFVHESIMGTTFTGRLIEECTVGPYSAVVPTITGQAWIYGLSTYLVDPPIRSRRDSRLEIFGAVSIREEHPGFAVARA